MMWVQHHTRGGIAYAKGCFKGHCESSVSLDEGAAAVTLVFAHATSLCKEIWGPVLSAVERQLRSRREMGPVGWVCLDFPGHGDSRSIRAEEHWSEFTAAALREVIAEAVPAASLDTSEANKASPTTPPCVLGIGHSMGGGGIAYLQQAHKSFDGGLLLEPVLPTLSLKLASYVAKNALVDRARRRRSAWPSRGDAADYFSSSRLDSWHPAAVDAYITGGLRPVGDLGTVQLKCAPLDEAKIYSSLGPLLMLPLARQFRTPLSQPRGEGWVIAAGSKSTFPVLSGPAYFSYVAGLLGSRLVNMPGASHFAVQEQPDDFARHVLDLVEWHQMRRLGGSPHEREK